MAGNVVADAAEILILRREGGIVLVLPVDLAGEQVVARLQLASLGHAADGGEEQGRRPPCRWPAPAAASARGAG